MTHDYSLKLCILGDMGTGKTSLLERLCNNCFQTVYSSTIGVDFKTYNIYLKDPDKIIKLQIWDTAGQEQFLSIIRSYFRKMAGCILVYDLTDIHSFNNLKKWVDELEFYCLSKPVLSIVGNKSDLKNKVIDQYSKDSLKEKLNHFDIEFIDVSVKDNINIDYIFDNLVTRIYDNLINNPDIDFDDYDIKKSKSTITHFEMSDINIKKKKCCRIS